MQTPASITKQTSVTYLTGKLWSGFILSRRLYSCRSDWDSEAQQYNAAPQKMISKFLGQHRSLVVKLGNGDTMYYIAASCSRRCCDVQSHFSIQIIHNMAHDKNELTQGTTQCFTEDRSILCCQKKLHSTTVLRLHVFKNSSMTASAAK